MGTWPKFIAATNPNQRKYIDENITFNCRDTGWAPSNQNGPPAERDPQERWFSALHEIDDLLRHQESTSRWGEGTRSALAVYI